MDTGTGSSTEVAALGYQVNAIGYASQQNLAYGIATRDGKHRFGNDGHLVSISPLGTVVDLGAVHGTVDGLSDAYAGAVVGSRLYLRAGGLLYSVGIDPNTAGFRSVTRVVGLDPGWLAAGVDDFDLDAANGLLYGVASADPWHAEVISVDPNSGAVRKVESLQGLSASASYGSVVLAGQIMYAVADDVGGYSRLYRIPLDGSGSATQVASWAAASVTDMAGCLDTPIIPTTTTMPTLPRTTTPVPPAVDRSNPLAPAKVIVPSPVVPATTTTTTTPPTPAALVPIPPTSSISPFPLPAARTIAAVSDQERTTQRRWALTTVLIIFGGGAVAARRTSARARR